jgi:hypothetical protein
MINYDRNWTILGLVDVEEDMHLQPTERLRLIEEPKGTFRIVIQGPDKFLEKFQDLKEVEGDDPVIKDLPKRDSVVLQDRGPYANKVRAFKDSALLSSRRLFQRITQGTDVEEMHIAVPKAADGREILVLRIVHTKAELAQNGTGHGDWT